MQVDTLNGIASFAPQAWVISVGGASLMMVRAALWLKDSKTGANGNNGKVLMAKESGKFEGKVLELTKRVVDLQELVCDTQKRDREKWAPALTGLMEAQQKMMRVLDGNAKLLQRQAKQLDEHTEHSTRIWEGVVAELQCMANGVGELPCQGEEDTED